MLGIQRSTIYHDPHITDDAGDAGITTTRKTIALILGGQKTLEEAFEAKEIAIQGNIELVNSFFESQESFVTAPLIEPKETY